MASWNGSAVLSPCGAYRYRLRRLGLATGNRRVVFVMLNPSTADAVVDDPTIRRCIGFARAFDCERLEVVNLYALRSPNPADLRDSTEAGIDPVGPDNDRSIREASDGASLIVCAWGAHPMAVARVATVLDVLPRPLHCLGFTKHRAPRHPLYVPASTPLWVWKAER